MKALCLSLLFSPTALFCVESNNTEISLSLSPGQETLFVQEERNISLPMLLYIAVEDNAHYLEGMDLTVYLDQSLTLETVKTIEHDIKQHLLANNYSMVVVDIPEQDVSNGTLTIHLQDARAATVEFAGNRWFSDNFLRSRISTAPGSKIDEDSILNDIAWLNRNPFHHTEVVLSPGKEVGTSDVEFITKDRFPLRFYAGVDNTGIQSTGEIRLYTGANWGDAFWSGDLLSYQFTTSPDYEQFHSQFGSYTIFLPWKHLMTLYGGYATIHPDILGFKSHGTDAQASGRYIIPFHPLYKAFLQEFTFGYDYKQYNNDLFFTEGALPIATQRININQFYLGYQRQYLGSTHQTTFKLELIGSPGKWLPHQTKADYGSLRPHATPKYIYGRMAVGDIYTMRQSKAVLSWLFRGQLASSPLLPSEQFALGGHDTVRGYDENDYNADNAVCFNVELHTPKWKPIQKINNTLFFLGFFDIGWGRNDQTTITLPSTETLAGAGLGVRYNIGPYLTARLDYGFQLHHIFDDHRFGKFHFAVVGAY